MEIFVVFRKDNTVLRAFVDEITANKLRDEYNIDNGGKDSDKAFVVKTFLDGFESKILGIVLSIDKKLKNLEDSVNDLQLQ